jgi:hypothetical protein
LASDDSVVRRAPAESGLDMLLLLLLVVVPRKKVLLLVH